MSRYHRVGDKFVPTEYRKIYQAFFILIEINENGIWRYLGEDGKIISRTEPLNPRVWKWTENLEAPLPQGWTING